MDRLQRLAGPRSPGNDHGSVVTEFALVAPVLFTLLLCAFELSHTLYTKVVLESMLQKAARDSTLESAASTKTQAALDQKVSDAVHQLVGSAEVKFTRKAYYSFRYASVKKEDFIDGNKNSNCDNGETYEDANRSGTWDADAGTDGRGGAKDAVVYTATVTYKHLIPIWRMLGGGEDVVLRATTVLRNQPSEDQLAPLTGTCK